jgi:hypothetical protein
MGKEGRNLYLVPWRVTPDCPLPSVFIYSMWFFISIISVMGETDDLI